MRCRWLERGVYGGGGAEGCLSGKLSFWVSMSRGWKACEGVVMVMKLKCWCTVRLRGK